MRWLWAWLTRVDFDHKYPTVIANKVDKWERELHWRYLPHTAQEPRR